MEKNDSSFSLEQFIPTELLFKIFLYLDNLQNYRAVCSYWKYIIDNIPRYNKILNTNDLSEYFVDCIPSNNMFDIIVRSKWKGDIKTLLYHDEDYLCVIKYNKEVIKLMLGIEPVLDLHNIHIDELYISDYTSFVNITIGKNVTITNVIGNDINIPKINYNYLCSFSFIEYNNKIVHENTLLEFNNIKSYQCLYKLYIKSNDLPDIEYLTLKLDSCKDGIYIYNVYYKPEDIQIYELKLINHKIVHINSSDNIFMFSIIKYLNKLILNERRTIEKWDIIKLLLNEGLTKWDIDRLTIIDVRDYNYRSLSKYIDNNKTIQIVYFYKKYKFKNYFYIGYIKRLKSYVYIRNKNNIIYVLDQLLPNDIHDLNYL